MRCRAGWDGPARCLPPSTSMPSPISSRLRKESRAACHFRQPSRDRLETLAFHRGLLILGCGPNSIRLCPPLVITTDQADWAIDTLEECLKTLEPAPSSTSVAG